MEETLAPADERVDDVPARSGPRSDGQDLVAVFDGLLALHPDALVASIGDDGLFAPMPVSVPLQRHRVVVARSVIDIVVPEDKVAVITTWERSRSEGGANAVVHLLGDPERAVMLTFVDARERHGTHLALLLPANDLHRGIGASSVPAPVAPRTARVRKSELAVVAEIDLATTVIFGWEPAQMVGKRSLDFIHPDDQDRAISNWMEMLTAPGHEQRVRLRHLTADGGWVWVEISNRNLLATEGQGCVLTEMLDISEELAAQEALRASEQRLRRLAEALPLGVVQIETDRTITYANERLGEITGAARCATTGEQFRHVVAADEERFAAALDGVLVDAIDQDVQVRFDLGRGLGVRLCTLSMRAITTNSGEVTGAIVGVSDVTDQVRMTAELERRATYDALTGCLNRRSIVSMLETHLAAPGDGVGIVFVDLDGFKQVNDTLGHAAGDAVLVEVADRLRGAVRPGDLVGRVGGDEFLVVVVGVPSDDDVVALAQRVDAALEDGVEFGGLLLQVGASLGVAHTTVEGASSDHLVAEADTAMYAMKRARRVHRGTAPRHVVERPSNLRTRAEDDVEALRIAIAARELEVHYQPVVSVADRRIVGAEALLRWRRDGEIIPAVAFISVAERSGLVIELGRYVIDEVCREAAATSEPFRWHVNMSPRELGAPSAVGMVLDALDRHLLPPDRLVIEVTEHADLAESSGAVRAVHELAAAGIGIALDDFGTGYSSLSLLRTLPVGCLKVDRSFTMDLTVDPVAGHVLDCCHDLATRLGIDVVVEGVETEAQLAELHRRGITAAQGFLFSPARPIGELRAMLAASRPYR